MGQTSLQTSSTKILAAKLSPSEQLVIDMKYAGPRFSTMDGISRSTESAGLLLRINAATGWKFPESNVSKQALQNEFTQYLLESCGDMTREEVAYAVRTKGLTVIDWGKSINLSLINQCVEDYRIDRAALSEVERMASQTQGVAEKELIPAGPSDWSAQWDDAVEWAKNGQIYKAIIPAALYDWMDRMKIVLISEEESVSGVVGITKQMKFDIFVDVTDQYINEMEDAILNNSPHIEPTHEIKRRLSLLKTNRRAWKEDLFINATLTNLAKIETVRQLAIMTAAKEQL